ncbi:MAG TPA: hypothetical protein VK816_00570 [Jatrophihabitantaceae bacterium]|jgi:hypothetical protein|nr:hypothetical protein [Jatrophihabitantaceae bacterium]
MARVMLVELGHARSGDKGDSCNVGFVAWDRDLYPALAERVTEETVRQHLTGIVKGKVTRYELPSIGAFNFILENSLDGGGTKTLRVDALGKAMCEALLRMEIDLPEELARKAKPRPRLLASNEAIIVHGNGALTA